MNITEKREACNKFFDELAESMEGYVVVGSCNKDFSRYLVPKGTEDQITYSSKPYGSYRISDHWNWYANVKKCSNPYYIQCLSPDFPRARKRIAEGQASQPIKAVAVAAIGDDGKYHVIFGEKYDRQKAYWSWFNGEEKN